jgi:hypothetical protein
VHTSDSEGACQVDLKVKNNTDEKFTATKIDTILFDATMGPLLFIAWW